MVDNISNATQIIANNAKTIDAPGLDTKKDQSFGDVLRQTAVDSIQTLRAGESASARAVSGEATLPEVVQAITASEITLQTVVAVRDRVITAYQEMMRMPV